MSYLTRKELYKQIEEKRRKPIIAYVTSIRTGCSAQMAQDVIPEIIKQINKIDSNNKEVDLLILSNGGDPIVSWRIISLLREKFDKISVLIPYTAYSAATLLALGADEIIMHPFGNLGPIDPQINISNNQGQTTTLGYEDITKYIEFVKGIGITDQELVARAFDKLTSEIPPTLIGFAKRSSQLGLSMGEKLLKTHMKDENKIKVISETLNTKFYHHGYPLGRKEAKDIGLPIQDVSDDIKDLMWKITEDFMDELEFDKPFNPNIIIQEKLSQQPQPEPNIPNVISEQVKHVCLESIKMNSYTALDIVATYVMQEDTSLNTNIMINSGPWINEEGEE
jgi:hypothetical protein